MKISEALRQEMQAHMIDNRKMIEELEDAEIVGILLRAQTLIKIFESEGDGCGVLLMALGCQKLLQSKGLLE